MIQSQQRVETIGLPRSTLEARSKTSKMKDFPLIFVSNPLQPTSKEELKAVRQHVMNHYIRSSGCDPRAKRKRLDTESSSGDARARRRRPDTSPTDRSEDQDRSRASSGGLSSTPSPQPSKASTSKSVVEDVDAGEFALPTPEQFFGPQVSRLAVQDITSSPAITSYDKARLMNPYLATNTTTILSRDGGIGSKVNPFNSWPEIKNGVRDVERLKWLCTRCFRCQGITTKWLPALLHHAIAFYSTISISSAHDDIMYRELNPAGLHRAKETYQRMAVRDGVIKMIAEKLSRKDFGDGTIIAVLHILYSEVITGSQFSIDTHRDGLHRLVRGRGSLEKLGVDGLLAKVVVISMLMIPSLSEQFPDRLYVNFANRITTEPPTNDRGFSKSPLYAATPWSRVKSVDWKSDATTHLLELARQASDYFAIANRMTDEFSVSSRVTEEQARLSLGHIHDHVFNLGRVSSMADKTSATFEAVRLVTRIYIHALYKRMPFSKAMQDLESVIPSKRKTQRCDSVVDVSEPEQSSILVQMKEALKRTSIDDLWGMQAGVLLWAGMVVLSASHNGAARVYSDDLEHRTTEQAARQFIAATVVRCAIRQIFEHTMGMLGMLKRFVALQRVLAEGSGDVVVGSSVLGDGQQFYLSDAAYEELIAGS